MSKMFKVWTAKIEVTKKLHSCACDTCDALVNTIPILPDCKHKQIQDHKMQS